MNKKSLIKLTTALYKCLTVLMIFKYLGQDRYSEIQTQIQKVVEYETIRTRNTAEQWTPLIIYTLHSPVKTLHYTLYTLHSPVRPLDNAWYILRTQSR